MAIEIVSFPIENGGSFHSYVKLPKVMDQEGTYFWLVGKTYPSEKDERIIQVTWDEMKFPTEWEKKHLPNHQPDFRRASKQFGYSMVLQRFFFEF